MAPFAAATLLAILASVAFAAPTAFSPVKSASTRKAIIPIVPEVPTTVLSKVSAVVEPIAASFTSSSAAPVNQLQSALDFIGNQLSANTFSSYIVKDSYTTKHNGLLHVYLRQVVNGLEVINGDININVLPDGSILSSGNSFFNGDEAPLPSGESLVSKLSPLQALESFGNLIGEQVSPKNFFSTAGVQQVQLDEDSYMIRNVPFALSDVKARRVYIQTEEGILRLGWELTVEMEQNWFYTVVDQENGAILNVNDWVSEASPTYRVFPFGVEDPTYGSRALVANTENFDASPLGWHDDGSTKYTDTRGNNADAFSKASSVQRHPSGGSSLTFDFPANIDVDDPKVYYEAGTTQLFYVMNRYHDLLYQLGFDEVAGNFQTNNFGKGGKGGDAVVASAQDPADYNNANFATPADGSAGKMNIYLWSSTKPNRDGDLQQGLIIHEYTHGLSNRLTGGPSNVNCLSSGEYGGMGEGWGDAVANVLAQKASYTRYTKVPLAAYVSGRTNGLRSYPYTSDQSIDPETYKYLAKLGYSEVHAIGEVWAGILHEVYWNLRDAKGFEPDLFSVDVSTAAARKKAKGDVIFLLNLLDGMKTQPCKPTFLQARDAMIAADAVNFDGENVCTMWKGFALRGLGVSAKKTLTGRVEDYDIPASCK